MDSEGYTLSFFLPGGTKKRTSNIERPTSNFEWEKMQVSVHRFRVHRSELTFFSNIARKPVFYNRVPLKLNCGAERHHYSMFDVGRSDVRRHLLIQARVKLHQVKSEPQNRRISNIECRRWVRFAQSFFIK